MCAPISGLPHIYLYFSPTAWRCQDDVSLMPRSEFRVADPGDLVGSGTCSDPV